MNKAITWVISLLLLSSCSQSKGNKITLEEQAVIDAKNSPLETHKAYFACYALDQQSKSKCNQEFANKFINKKHRNNTQYTKSFQFEAEKLGFVKFLQDQGLPCDGIDHGPEFIDIAKAYMVTCNNGNNYFLRFNYNDKVWAYDNS